MSPNHLELDRAIQELKIEQPGREQRSRSLDALLTPRRSALRLPGLTAAAAIVIASVLLIPTRGSGLAWAEIVRRTQQAANVHIINLDDRGQVRGENWRSGTMWAQWHKDKSGRITSEIRSDHAYFYSYVYRKELRSPNAVQYALLGGKTHPTPTYNKRFGDPVQTIDTILKPGRAKLISQERAESEGTPVQRYVLKMYGRELQTVDADPKTGRILFIRFKAGEVAKFEYPESIDPNVFSFKSRLTRDVAVLDLRGKEDPKKLPPYMPRTMASKGGIQLREVSIGEGGDLFVFWTGYSPDKRSSKRLKVIGVKTGATRWLGYYRDGVHPASVTRLMCYRVELLEKIGDRVTVRIPTASSTVEFKNVRVSRLRPIKE